MTTTLRDPRDVIDQLRRSEEPFIRTKLLTSVLGQTPDEPELGEALSAIPRSPRALELLRDWKDYSPYDKWRGGHWVLATLADLGYPPKVEALAPLVASVLDTWLGDHYFASIDCETKAAAHRAQKIGVAKLQGRHRRCASQQGNALFSATQLGFLDERADRLVERLLFWQWPDGGWNCDKNPDAGVSSFMETLTPLRGLAAYAKATGSKAALAGVDRAAEVFLTRRLFRRRSDGGVMRDRFIRLHYPCYWQYDFLFGLKVMVESGKIGDPRCKDALDLLESKMLPDGGWPAEESFYTVSKKAKASIERVDWGGVSKRRMNPWVTVDALTVLKAADRLPL